MKKNRLTLYILIAMAAGIIVGYLMHEVGTGHKITYSLQKIIQVKTLSHWFCRVGK